MLPYGKRDRPTYATASPRRAKEFRGLVLIDFLVNGL